MVAWLLNYFILLYADDFVFSEAAEHLEKEACFQKATADYIYAMLKTAY